MAARNKRQDQDYNMEGMNIWSDAWLAGMNQTVNNMEGPLPFTPHFEFKVGGNYTIPKIEVDLGPSIPLPYRPSELDPWRKFNSSISGITIQRMPI